jgi:hypothetical protein
LIQGLDPLRTPYVTSRVTGAGNYFGDVQGVGARKNTGIDSRLRDGGRAYKQTGDCREYGAGTRHAITSAAVVLGILPERM